MKNKGVSDFAYDAKKITVIYFTVPEFPAAGCFLSSV